jgi:hypothetical protein
MTKVMRWSHSHKHQTDRSKERCLHHPNGIQHPRTTRLPTPTHPALQSIYPHSLWQKGVEHEAPCMALPPTNQLCPSRLHGHKTPHAPHTIPRHQLTAPENPILAYSPPLMSCCWGLGLGSTLGPVPSPGGPKSEILILHQIKGTGWWLKTEELSHRFN